MVQSIVEHFLELADAEPERPLLHFEGRHWSRGELADRVRAFADGLRGEGLASGDRVALFLENRPAFIVAWLGVQLSGAVGVPINTAYREVELGHILGHAGVRVAITDQAGIAHLAPLLADHPALELLVLVEAEAPPLAPNVRVLHYAELLTRGRPGAEFVPLQGGELAALGYTSGTTGRAKGAMLRHGNLLANARAVTSAWEWTQGDRLLLTLPLFHAHGLMVGLHGTLVSGGELDLRRKFQAPEVLQALAAEPAPSMFFGVPTMYGRLVEEARRTSARIHPLRLMVSGSAPLSASLHAEVEQAFGQRILERYGMTETGMNTTNPYRGERRPGTVGHPFPGQEARVVDPRTRAPLPVGETGEIEVRGPNVFAGYWEDPQATAAAIDLQGWFATGDLGSVDGEGYFHITGRARELIISGGFNVYPREVEELLLTHPGVAEVAVLGLPDPDLGEQVVATIVPRGEAPSPEALIDYCREHLASFKKPRRITFVEALPRNALGKVQKHVLRAALLAE
jgi:malonyl-CoA/methylmalonyl-CoA synthetase